MSTFTPNELTYPFTPPAKHAVVIAGGGPTGLMLAAELALARVDVADRRAARQPGPRRLARRRSALAHDRGARSAWRRGALPRARGRSMQVAGFAGIPLDISDFPTRHNYGLALWQNHIERILAAWVDELAVPIYRGREVTGFAQDDTGVDVELSDGRSLRAKYLVGCDGGRSLIRKKAGIDFPGWDPSTQLPDRRGRDDRGAGVGHPPRRQGHQASASSRTGSACGSC